MKKLFCLINILINNFWIKDIFSQLYSDNWTSNISNCNKCWSALLKECPNLECPTWDSVLLGKCPTAIVSFLRLCCYLSVQLSECPTEGVSCWRVFYYGVSYSRMSWMWLFKYAYDNEEQHTNYFNGNSSGITII